MPTQRKAGYLPCGLYRDPSRAVIPGYIPGGSIDWGTRANFGAEYAKSGRSACKVCGQLIADKELRMCLYLVDLGEPYKSANWHHVDCFFKHWETLKLKSPKYEVKGFDYLSEVDQRLVLDRHKKFIEAHPTEAKEARAETAKSLGLDDDDDSSYAASSSSSDDEDDDVPAPSASAKGKKKATTTAQKKTPVVKKNASVKKAASKTKAKRAPAGTKAKKTPSPKAAAKKKATARPTSSKKPKKSTTKTATSTAKKRVPKKK